MRKTAMTTFTALVLTLGLSACSTPTNEPASSPTADSASTSTSGSASTQESPASSNETQESDQAEVESDLPPSLFEEGGTTFAEFMEQNPESDYFDESKETILQEKLATKEAQITLSAQDGAEYRVMLFCPSDAIGKTDVYVSSTPDGERDWKAGSDGLCGDWSAGLPPVTEAGPMTITATVDNDRPFRMVLATSSD